MSICDHDEIKMAESFGVPSNSWHNEGNENLNEVDKHEGWCD
jgi:hypothetical protein